MKTIEMAEDTRTEHGYVKTRAMNEPANILTYSSFSNI